MCSFRHRRLVLKLVNGQYIRPIAILRIMRYITEQFQSHCEMLYRDLLVHSDLGVANQYRKFS